jgi:nucleoside-diphosphate-sugar epimerase
VTADVPSLSAETVLVTGASGFIGSNLCERLARSGAEVHAVSRAVRPDLPARVRPWRSDISHSEEVKRIFREVKPTVVFHLAGHVQGSRALEQVEASLVGNLVTAVHMLTAAVESGCERIVLTGSQDEPDPGESDATEFVPPSPYAASKLASSAYTRMFHALYDCPTSIARIFMGYGPAQRDLQKLVPYVILSLLRGQAPRVGSGSRPMDWIFVDDIVDGLLLTAKSPRALGKTVHLGTGTLHTARQAVESIVRLMKSRLSPEFGAVPDRRAEKARGANVEETRALLGWQPAVAFDLGLERTIAWYRGELERGAL